MLVKNEHAKNPEIWCGLNRPGMAEKDADAVVFGIPFDGGVSYRGGAAEAPDTLRANTTCSTPCTEKLEFYSDFNVVDAGNFTGDDREAMFAEIQKYVKGLVQAGVKFTMVICHMATLNEGHLNWNMSLHLRTCISSVFGLLSRMNFSYIKKMIFR